MNKMVKEMSGEKTGKLSMSLIDKMIRSEQRNSSYFGDELRHRETNYYGRLWDNEKKEFDSYLRFKKIKKGLFVFVLFFLGLSFVLMNSNMTGNVIAQKIGLDSLSSFSNMFILCVGGAFLILFVAYLMKVKWDVRLEKDFEVIDQIFLEKRVAKRL